jgi:hypothetical protein
MRLVLPSILNFSPLTGLRAATIRNVWEKVPLRWSKALKTDTWETAAKDHESEGSLPRGELPLSGKWKIE